MAEWLHHHRNPQQGFHTAADRGAVGRKQCGRGEAAAVCVGRVLNWAELRAGSVCIKHERMSSGGGGGFGRRNTHTRARAKSHCRRCRPSLPVGAGAAARQKMELVMGHSACDVSSHCCAPAPAAFGVLAVSRRRRVNQQVRTVLVVRVEMRGADRGNHLGLDRNDRRNDHRLNDKDAGACRKVAAVAHCADRGAAVVCAFSL